MLSFEQSSRDTPGAPLGWTSGDFIGDVRIEESWGYRLVGTSYCTRLTAKAIRANGAGPYAMPQGPGASASPSFAAPAPAPVVPAPAALPVQAPTPVATRVAGSTVVLRSAMVLRGRPVANSEAVANLAAGTSVVLSFKTANSGGTWWYVTLPNGSSGWLADNEMDY